MVTQTRFNITLFVRCVSCCKVLEAKRHHVPRDRQPVDVHKDCVLRDVGTEVMFTAYVSTDIEVANTTIIVSDMPG